MKGIAGILKPLLVLALAMTSANSQTTSRAIPSPTPDELGWQSQWFKRQLDHPKQRQPFSFIFAGRPSAELLATWPVKTRHLHLDNARTEHTYLWTDPATRLEVRCVVVSHADHPVLEWTVYFKNTGSVTTPILEDIQGVDVPFERGEKGEFLLHGIKGDFCTADSYEPYQIQLTSNLTKRFSPPANSGKSCDGAEGWPYYNLQLAGTGGVILAIGWPGQWASSFARDSARIVRVRAGQQLTHLVLRPAEEIRTPLITVLFWKGDDVVRSQNLWRRWYLARILPRINGRPQPPASQIQIGGGIRDIPYAKSFLDAGIHPDICWRDAGGAYTWYPNTNGPYSGNDSWLNTGTWEIDPARYPEGFRPFSDWAHSNHMQFLLWFEPERVGSTNSWLGQQHPEWLLPGSSHGPILNLGNPQALAWLVDHIDSMIKTQGLDWYREDMNGCGPLPAWRKNDPPDRQGITENFFVQGHLAFWDELRRRNPHLHIDSCASGGRRNDIETMRRAVPLLRSDFQFPEMKGVVEGNQGHTYGLSFWLPFQGTGCYFYDSYSARSFYLPSFGMGGLAPENTAAQRKAYYECARIAPLMLADYYPLTPYSLRPDQWIAWQFDRPERGDGVVQVFRRSQCSESTITLRLNNLAPSAGYEITNFDQPQTKLVAAKELMEQGLRVEIKDRPGAAVVLYRIVTHR